MRVKYTVKENIRKRYSISKNTTGSCNKFSPTFFDSREKLTLKLVHPRTFKLHYPKRKKKKKNRSYRGENFRLHFLLLFFFFSFSRRISYFNLLRVYLPPIYASTKIFFSLTYKEKFETFSSDYGTSRSNYELNHRDSTRTGKSWKIIRPLESRVSREIVFPGKKDAPSPFSNLRARSTKLIYNKNSVWEDFLNRLQGF